jgi:AraC-like DNA-binding protein
MALPFAPEVLSSEDLLLAIRNATPSTVVVVQPFAGDSAIPNAWIRNLTGAAGLVPVVALVRFQPAYKAGIETLLSWGVTEIADQEFEASSSAIRQRLLDSHGKPFKARVEQHLSQRVSQNGVTLLRAAAAVALDGGTSVDLAHSLGSSERTVPGWCTREGLPAPRRLLAWMRALLAVALLEQQHRSVLQVARCVGYASDHPLRRAFRELLGGEPSAKPRERSFEGAMQRFNEELRTLREQARRVKPGMRAA